MKTAPKPKTEAAPDLTAYRVRLSHAQFEITARRLLLGPDLRDHPIAIASGLSRTNRSLLGNTAEVAWGIDGNGRLLPQDVVAIFVWIRKEASGGLHLPEVPRGKITSQPVDTVLLLRDRYVLGVPRTIEAAMGHVLATVEILVDPERIRYDADDMENLSRLA